MWWGKDTEELNELKRAYEEKFGYNPDGEMDLDYGQEDYDDYVNDLKTAIRIGKGIADFVE